MSKWCADDFSPDGSADGSSCFLFCHYPLILIAPPPPTTTFLLKMLTNCCTATTTFQMFQGDWWKKPAYTKKHWTYCVHGCHSFPSNQSQSITDRMYFYIKTPPLLLLLYSTMSHKDVSEVLSPSHLSLNPDFPVGQTRWVITRSKQEANEH